MKNKRTTPNAGVPAVLLYFMFAIVLLSTLSLLSTWWQRGIEHRIDYPFGYWLLPRTSWSFDFNCFATRFQAFRTPRFFSTGIQPFNYPAPLAIFYALMFHTFSDPATVFRIAFAVIWVVAALLVWRVFTRSGMNTLFAGLLILATLLLSYPLQLMLFLDNVEAVVWLFTACGLLAFIRNRSWTAALCFGVAGSMKYFPLIYLGLLFSRRQYREIGVALLTCIMLIAASLAVIGPTIPAAWHSLSSQLLLFRDYYIDGWHAMESGIDHSAYGLIKLPLRAAHHLAILKNFAAPYVVTGVAAALLLYFLRIRKLPVLNQVLALSIISVLLPPVSHDYTLVHLYAPWVLLSLYAIEHKEERWLCVAFSCFAILFTSQNYLVIHTATPNSIEANFRWAGQLKAVTLFALLGITTWKRAVQVRTGQYANVEGDDVEVRIIRHTAA